jgi:hypothetical protein
MGAGLLQTDATGEPAIPACGKGWLGTDIAGEITGKPQDVGNATSSGAFDGVTGAEPKFNLNSNDFNAPLLLGGIKIVEKGGYVFKYIDGDLQHGGRHIHVYQKGKLLGRVGQGLRTLTGKVPRCRPGRNVKDTLCWNDFVGHVLD